MFKIFSSLFKKKEIEPQASQVKIGLIINIDQERYDKERLASELKREGKIDEACKVLYEIRDKYTSIDTRLPLYLQQAGKFNESIIEMKRIIRSSPKIYNEDFSHLSVSKRNHQLLRSYSHVFDKLRLIHQREKLHVQALYFGIMSMAFECYSMKAHIEEDMDGYFTLSETLSSDMIKTLCKKAKLDNSEIEEYLISNLQATECSFESIKEVNKILSSKLGIDVWGVHII